MVAVVVENGAAFEIPRVSERVSGLGPVLSPGALQVYPGSHSVNKANGQDLIIRWTVRNDGGVVGKAILDLRMIPAGSTSGGQVAQTQPVPINPTFAIPLLLFWPIQLPPGKSTGIILMWDFTNNDFSKLLGEHVFSVNI